MRAQAQDIVYIIVLFAFICVCICAYNLHIIGSNWRRRKSDAQKSQEIGRILRRALRARTHGEGIDSVDAARLGRLLRKGDGLILLNAEMQQLQAARPLAALLADTLVGLTRHYRGRTDMEQIYLAYTYAVAGVKSPVIEAFLMDCLKSSNLYLRIQALKTLSQVGTAEVLAEAIERISAGDILFSNKLITDVLTGYRGDTTTLSREIMDRMPNLPPLVQVAFINSLQARKDACLCGRLAEHLRDERLDMEVQIALMKYFSEVHCEEALEPILQMTQSDVWERVAIAAKTLRNYPDMRSIARVQSLLGDRNWFVRLNSAMTLVAIVPDASYYEDILRGTDPYARDILQYAIERVALAA